MNFYNVICKDVSNPVKCMDVYEKIRSYHWLEQISDVGVWARTPYKEICVLYGIVTY